jgi:hypothetical protein
VCPICRNMASDLIRDVLKINFFQEQLEFLYWAAVEYLREFKIYDT